MSGLELGDARRRECHGERLWNSETDDPVKVASVPTRQRLHGGFERARGSERLLAQWRHLHPCRTPDDDPAAQGRLERLQAACDRRPIHLQFLCSCIEATLSDDEEEGDQPFHLGDGFPALHRLMMHERTSSVQFPLSQMH
ncbi:Uncharacterised protein [Micrococcus luteus NCTC 2665]|uniref:Uncharacterized protein n=1 Tax=Micrococcus luteus (strain ATCC 4698 / DSM 20030 / JCM 1464 / CCM 169 / CCUG 5858 / IAM 1056 / NBRC 3333 / NCIMB 9278 / NCTC 2665 / VKM Ac-2230) TaxID=465515 RepID=A0A7Z7KLU4_MICLC|nr:Uncharacterised protein [Micrococcus luteus NCTC 2665]